MSWTHLNDRQPTARADYKCYLCGLPINKGTKHVARTGISHGELSTFRMHNECEAKARRWDQMDWDTFSDDYAEFRQYELGMVP